MKRLPDGQLSENAALQYWLAFSLIPDIGRNNKVWKATSDDPELGFGVPVSTELAKYLEGECTQALVHLHRASRLSYCEWGNDLRADGLRLIAPYDQKGWDLARFALLRARWHLEHNSWDSGIDDVIATMMLARHLSRDRLWHSIHFGCMVEGMAIGTTAVYLLGMPGTTLERLRTRLAALPPFTSMREAILYSENAIDWAVSELKRADTDDLLWHVVSSISRSEDFARNIIERARNRDGLFRMADKARELVQMFANAMSLGPSMYDRLFKEQFEPILRENPLAALLGIWYEAARDEEATADCRMVLLKAAIDVAERGMTALQDHLDPYGNGPFKCELFGGGFRLFSGLWYGKLRIGMTFGQIKVRPM